MKTYFGLALAAGSLFWACGGDVKVDGDPGSQREGQGGAGASSSSSSSSSSVGAAPSTSTGPTPSTSTGPTPVCDCFGACNKLINECGAGGLDCNQFCSEVPPDIWECICNMQNCDVRACIGGTGGSGGSPASCSGCFEEAANGVCFSQTNDCVNNPDCVSLFECHFDCGLDPSCNDKCAMSFPGGFMEFYPLVNCAVCGQCFDQCSATGLAQYCFDG